MPFKSKKQRKFVNANRDEMERKGMDVDEWNNASKGKKLPERSKKKKHGRKGAKKHGRSSGRS